MEISSGEYPIFFYVSAPFLSGLEYRTAFLLELVDHRDRVKHVEFLALKLRNMYELLQAALL